MKPKAAFHELQKEKLCFQCLYPRAYKEKYWEWHCQRDFQSQHKSHDKYSKRKHALVFQEHSNTDEK